MLRTTSLAARQRFYTPPLPLPSTGSWLTHAFGVCICTRENTLEETRDPQTKAYQSLSIIVVTSRHLPSHCHFTLFPTWHLSRPFRPVHRHTSWHSHHDRCSSCIIIMHSNPSFCLANLSFPDSHARVPPLSTALQLWGSRLESRTLLNAGSELLDGRGQQALLIVVEVAKRQNLLDTGWLRVSQPLSPMPINSLRAPR